MEHINGDSTPQNLERLHGMLRGMIKESKRKVRRNRIHVGSGTAKFPRQTCEICLTNFDWAVVNNPVPQMSRCVKCKEMLAQGYTAVISLKNHAFVKSSKLAPGTIIKASEATLLKIKAKLNGNPTGQA